MIRVIFCSKKHTHTQVMCSSVVVFLWGWRLDQ